MMRRVGVPYPRRAKLRTGSRVRLGSSASVICASQLAEATRPNNRHDKQKRDSRLNLADHQLAPTESVRELQRLVWVLARRGHREDRQLLEPQGIRVSALRKQEYDPDTGRLLGGGYDDYAAAVTSTAAELHRAGIGHRLGFATEVGHRLCSGVVQRADLVVQAPQPKLRPRPQPNTRQQPAATPSSPATATSPATSTSPLRHRTRNGLADRHRSHRGRLPASDRRPPRHHRRPLGTHRRRNRPPTPRTDHQR